jgi:hypothetical protein
MKASKTISLEEKLNIIQDDDKHIGTHFLGETTSIISINSEYNSQNSITEENARLFFEEVNTLLIQCKIFQHLTNDINFHYDNVYF